MRVTRKTLKGADRIVRLGTAVGTIVGFLVAALCALSGPAAAQTSASFKLTESVLNAGGNPLDGSRPTSANFRIAFDAIGGLPGGRLTAPSYRAGGGFVATHAPTGDVLGVRFSGRTTLTWSRDPSAGTYNLYRNTLASLPGDYGSCYAPALTGPPYADAAVPAPGSGWFYLVTARNRLGEEGTKGHRSDGTERVNGTPCP